MENTGSVEEMVIPLIEEEKVKRHSIGLYESQWDFIASYAGAKGITKLAPAVTFVLNEFLRDKGFYRDDYRKSLAIINQYNDEQSGERVCETEQQVVHAEQSEIKSQESRAIDEIYPSQDKQG